MRIAVALILLSFSLPALCQTTISGTVTDAGTRQPLPYASVYINLTTIGVYADEHGRFTLKNVPLGRHELVASHVGYVSLQTTVEVRDTTQLKFSLRLVGVTLKEVSVRAKQDQRWKTQLKRFNVLFLGKHAEARQCRILNPWVLDFTEDATGRFTATASSNLIIENLGLGYKISYQLKKFEFTATQYAILGATWFQEIPASDTATLNLWARERRKVYKGSVTHLLASITRQSLRQDGFELYEDITHNPDVIRRATFNSNLNRSVAPLEVNDLVAKEKKPNQYTLNMPAKTEVHYLRGRAIPSIYRDVAVPLSWIEIKTGTNLVVNSSGVPVNPEVMIVSGAMSDSRIADLLPVDYDPGVLDSHPVVAAPTVPQPQYLIERTHIHTDKTFYYPGEKIWLKAYMNYSSPAFQDTLSNVLHVQLVNSRNDIIASKLLLIDTIGVATGNIDLSGLKAGTYQLRSSTRWMLNYDTSFVFTKTIRILNDDEVLGNRWIDTTNLSKQFSVVSDRSVYNAGDDVALTIRTADDEGFAYAGNISVSVAPLRYASIGSGDPDIYKDLSFEKVVSAPKSQSHPIQYGIDIKGTADMKSRKKKYREPIIMLAQEGTADLMSTRAGRDGSFEFTGLQLYDTMKLSIQAVSLKGNRRGLIRIDSAARTVIPAMPLKDVVAEVVRVEGPRRPVAPELTGPVSILKEVTIESTKPTRVVGSATHLSADIVVSGEDLRNSDNGDLIAMLQAKVPGLRVMVFTIGGILRKYFKLGGISTFDKNPLNHEPIVMIDGSVVSNQMGESGAEQVGRLNASMIDRIEVIKFGGSAAYGARGANGVIAVYTRTDFDKSRIIDNFDRKLFTPIRVKGYSSPGTYRGYQAYHNGNTIYWNPSVSLTRGEQQTIGFTLPEVKGTYAVHAEGRSAAGKPLRSVYLFEVR